MKFYENIHREKIAKEWIDKTVRKEDEEQRKGEEKKDVRKERRKWSKKQNNKDIC